MSDELDDEIEKLNRELNAISKETADVIREFGASKLLVKITMKLEALVQRLEKKGILTSEDSEYIKRLSTRATERVFENTK